MKNQKKIVRIFAAILAIALVLSLLMIPFAGMAYGAEKEDSVTVLFTHDLHDHLLPVNTTDENGITTSSGGYARLKTLMDEIRANNETTVTLDAGDFSMGSLFQSIFTSDAPELRMLGALGVDVTTFGNHEYDYGSSQLAQMLRNAMASGDPLPEIVEANYKNVADGVTDLALPDAIEEYGVKDYTMIERNGINIAVFGIMGYDSHECAPNSGMALDDPIETAKAVVAQIQANENADLIICLSHSGTNENLEKSEDHQLAEAVPEIDLIISGHTHTLLEQAEQVGNTYIVSADSYCRYLGEITLVYDGDHWVMRNYTLHSVDGSIAEDAVIAEKIDGFKTIVEEDYLSAYGLTFDQVLAKNDIVFTTDESGESSFGNLLADSYMYSVKLLEGAAYEPITMSVVPDGVIRSSLAVSELTTSDAFDVLSLGIGQDGTIGYPLISVYLTGKELSAAAEVDASVSRLLYPAAKLNLSGIIYTFNPNRIPLDFVTDLKVVKEDGHTVWPDDKQLHRVVTDMYTAQMLSSVTDMSYGLIKITPKDENGNEITDFNTRILYDEAGNEIKAWQCLAIYLSSFDKDADGISTVPDQYASTEGRIILNDDSDLSAIVSDPGTTTMIIIIALVVLVVLIVVVSQFFIRRWVNRLDYHEIDHL